MGIENKVGRYKNVALAASLLGIVGACTERKQDLTSDIKKGPCITKTETKDISDTLSAKEKKAYDIVVKVVDKYNLPCDYVPIVMSVIWKESSFRPGVVARGSGAIGYMQLKPSTAKPYGFSREDLFDPEKNIEAGTRYLVDNIKRFSKYTNNPEDALGLGLIAYNMGPSALDCLLKNSRDKSLDNVLGKLSKHKKRSVCVDPRSKKRFRLSRIRKKTAVNYHSRIKAKRDNYAKRLGYLAKNQRWKYDKR
jgi:soluble lytic murein transglycosylase-like protein